MEFGKLPKIEEVDFSLPPDPAGNAVVLAHQPQTPNHKPPRLYIGATGWSMKEWVGKIYPKGTKPPEMLRHYTRQFNTIELNSTHYHIPDHYTVLHWHDEAAADFRFCPKVLQRISHSRDLGVNGPLIEQFCEALSGLYSKLGPCFIQLPPYFGADRLPVLEEFLKKFSLPLAVEVRNESWFTNKQNFNRLSDLLEKYETSTVITDVAGRRDVCHMRLTSSKVLVRFVGNNLHPTDYSRIDEWTGRLGKWFGEGLSEAYFFTHEPDNLLAPDLAAYLFEKTKTIERIETRGPDIDGPNTGEQLSLF
ncbi:MAG: DUF72 domain-containing protein [Saprospiraceae bacterium]